MFKHVQNRKDVPSTNMYKVSRKELKPYVCGFVIQLITSLEKILGLLSYGLILIDSNLAITSYQELRVEGGGGAYNLPCLLIR